MIYIYVNNWDKEIWIDVIMGWSRIFFCLRTPFHNSFLKIFGIGWKSEGLWWWDPEILIKVIINTMTIRSEGKERVQRKHKCEKLHIHLINVHCLHIMRNGIRWMKCHGQILLINNKMQHYSYHDYICLEGFFCCDACIILFLKNCKSD